MASRWRPDEVASLVGALESDEVDSQLAAGFERGVVNVALLGYYEHGRLSDRQIAMLAQLVGRIRERLRYARYFAGADHAAGGP